MKMKFLALAAVAAAALTATQASATSFFINYSGVDVTSGTPFTANLTGDYDPVTHVATTVTGTRNGLLVTGISSYASATQHITGSFPYTDLGGLSYSVGAIDYNFFTYFDGLNYETNSAVNPGGDNSNPAATFSEIVPTSVAAAVPEPATWGMMLLGFGIMGFGLRGRVKQTVRVTYA